MTSRRILMAAAAVVLAGAVGACSALVDPTSDPPDPYEPAPTVLVPNPLCDASGCAPIDLDMWILMYQVPGLGAKPVGRITGRIGCIRLPGLDSMRVSQVDSTTVVSSHTYYWRPDNPSGVTLAIADPELYPRGFHDPSFGLSWESEMFVPADAPGWDMSFTPYSASSGPAYIGRIKPDTVACTPSSS